MTTRRLVIVGDPHAVVEELDDCRRLVDGVVELCRESQATTVLWLGDLFNTHAIVRVEVLAFWQETFSRLVDLGVQNVALVGNHDLPQSGAAGCHSLMTFDPALVHVIDTPRFLEGSHIALLPYMEAEEMRAWLAQHPEVQGLFCHQTWAGATYDNGFYAPDGVDTALLPPEAWVVSGHIHTPQSLGRVWYPGAPRWRTISDADVDRAIYALDVDLDKGTYAIVGATDTSEYCRKIESFVVANDQELAGLLATSNLAGARARLEGSVEFVTRAESLLRGKGIKFQSQVTVSAPETGLRLKVESEGVSASFLRYWEAYQTPEGVDRESLRALVSSRLGW